MNITAYTLQDLPIQEKTFLDVPLYIYASIVIPMLIFFLGQLILHRREMKKENKRLRLLEKYIFLNLDMLLLDLEKDIKNISILIEVLKEDKQQNYTSKGAIDIHSENILNINRTDIYNIFINGRKGNIDEKLILFDTLIKNVYSIDSNHKVFPNYFKEFITFMQEYGKNYSSSINILRTAFEDYIVMNDQYGIKKSEDSFIQEFDDLLYKWTKADDEESDLGPIKFDMFYVYKNILPQFVAFINKHKTDPRSRRLSDSIVESSAAIKSFINLKTLYISLFQTILKNYKNSKSEILDSMTKFKEMKEKTIKN